LSEPRSDYESWPLPARCTPNGAVAARAFRVLAVAPFPPRLDGRHGGSRALAQLLVRLAARHNVALLVLRALDEPAVDDVLRSACDFVEEVQIPCVGPSLRDRLINRVRLRAALLRGMPTWAAERNAPGFGARLEELVREWRPDVVQFEYRIMGQFLPAIAGSAPSLLVEHDPVRAERGRSALFGPVEERAWKSLGHAVSRQADSLVVFTERDRKTLSELSGSTPIARIPLGYTLPYPALDPAGTDPHGIVCVGSFIHPPNIDAALWLGREIFPFVKSRIPAASLQLVGSHAPLRSTRSIKGM
jgi:hypothetical protein